MRSLVLAVASALAIAPAAYAQYPDAPYYHRDRDRGDYARVIESTPVYAEASTQECWNPRTGNYEQPRESHRIGAGTALGAVAGGVLGHQIGSGRGNDVATAVGAVGGAAVGANVDRGQQTYTQNVQRCSSVPGSAQVAYWDVTYVFQGATHRAQLAFAPGHEQIAAGAVAIAVAWRWRRTFATIVAGLASLHLFHWLISGIFS